MRARKGVLTVYLSLIMTLILSLVMVSLESARVCMIRSQSQIFTDLAGEMLFSAYTKPLTDRYGLFVLDVGAHSEKLACFEDFLKANVEEDRPFVLSGQVEEVRYEDLIRIDCNDFENLKDQIVRFEKTLMGKEALDLITGSLTGLRKEEKEKNQCLSDLSEAGKVKAEAKSQEDGDETADEKPEDPREGMGNLLKRSILSLVMEDRPVSDRSISGQSFSFYTEPEKPIQVITDFLDGLKLAGQLKKEGTLTDLLGGAAHMGDSLIVDQYLNEHFGCLTDTRDAPSALMYEREYLLYGRDNDKDNLSSALTELFQLRMLLNLAFLYSDPGKSGQAEVLADSICAASALPVLAPAVKLMLLICWASGEALVDVSALTKGEKVVLIKSSDTWSLSLSQLVTLAKGEIGLSGLHKDSRQGLDYDHYLSLLLLKAGDNKKMIRMTRLMEANIRLSEGYEDFAFADCITGADFRARIHIPAAFFAHPGQVTETVRSSYKYK